MSKLTRRDTMSISVGATVAALGAISGNVEAANVATQNNTGAFAMNIERFGITEPVGGVPIISLSTVHNDIVYLCGVTADPAKLGDVKDQTSQVLDRIDRLLGRAGTNKSKLLTAQVWLTDMLLFEDHNAAWNAWVDPKSPPVRMCVQSPRLWRPGMLVEIMVTAAK